MFDIVAVEDVFSAASILIEIDEYALVFLLLCEQIVRDEVVAEDFNCYFAIVSGDVRAGRK